ncbi:non-hydrolyzing UDP-N-acetylglucosamine 2-epimerase [Pseudoalteromonas maricaloris]|uniref:non-hydrolyzing UDP-N-acetylglucosamine 2-epimerase n=1 Tax=Pseudoalteromonas maricaloris TaxID=184924 RepID=UPI00057DC384|nr:UDP-N-acetylglucosamine 2-epimerase (non-hydrolyzing) [Pseudoalteromonas flavipulchra]KID36143.1 UDP-N-acetylglucosamine 2-epimerase [Pseudoalteromonas flavipulchra NCIMB 2033 = ATCC BAA-314]MBD0780312.1 UDP-N-acetylglucosamine 2-epimerase (non-hydrolyzing) [Pseudoalteromonas flavipulchra]MBE0371568.1 UDP-GlcNAc3NAcA epimerase [Pseudoalteromonas flavipulchra NCIMB 2033 = ATCC BAA-314]
MKVVTVIGARPQFVKAATFSRAVREHNQTSQKAVQEVIVHTGQHYDANMSDIFFEEMQIPKPDYSLGIGGGTHGQMTGRQLEEIEKVLLEEKPDWVLVYGDTNSTLAGALAAAKLHIPVAHVEAGLRSFNMRMPEEINRILTDQISKILFCPTDTAVQNLVREGFKDKSCQVRNVGDVMLDAASFYTQSAKRPAIPEYDSFYLCTIHRAENTDDENRLKSIITALNELSETQPVICPIHPRTQKLAECLGLEIKFDVIPPVSYFEMVWLLEHCEIVLTDSGGLQKEAYFFSKPCITMRDQTEWVELVNTGVNQLVGADKQAILNAVDAAKATNFAQVESLYGNGEAAKAILAALLEFESA